MIETPPGIFLLNLSPSLAFWGAALLSAVVAAALALRISARWQLAGLLGLGASLRLFIATRNPLILQDWPLNDDSHYYFTIARNLATGHGLKHDSFHTTTGFQPLFLVLITPFELIGDKLLAINCILVFQAALGLVCGVVVYRLISLLTTPSLGILAAGVWATSWVFVTADLNGLETNVALVLLVTTLLFYVRHFRGATPPPAQAHIKLGLLCGLAFLARIDLGFLIPILALDLLWRYRAHIAGPQLLRLVMFGGCAVVPMLPWMLFNISLTGSILPSSGQAVRFISLAYGYGLVDPPGAVRRYFDISAIPLEYYRLTAVKAWRDLSAVLELTFPPWLGVTIAGAALAVAFRPAAERLRRLTVLAAFLIVLFAAYTCYIFGQWYLVRYLTPFAVGYLCAVMACMAALDAQLAKLGPWRRHLVETAFASLLLGMLVYPTLQSVVGTVRASKTTELYQMAQWINANTPPNAVIGAFQSGIMGYYLERKFHGLDGKINTEALDAMRNMRMDRYVRESAINYLTDWDWILNDLYTRRSEEPNALARHKRLVDRPNLLYQMTFGAQAPLAP